jgi:hypothetical protein
MAGCEKGLALALGLVAALAAGPARAAPKVYEIGPFSDELKATLTIEDSAEVFRPGAVSVFERKSGRRLLHVTSDELTLDSVDGKVPVNQNLPYARQSVLIYDDFDFDGRPDLAIMDGQRSCYHGPSFQIFLRRGERFVKSGAFTRLAQEYCGMFGVDAKAKHLLAFSKNGCCFHVAYTFVVVNRAPQLLGTVTESVDMSSPAYLERETSGARALTERLLLAPQDSGRQPLLAFDLVGPQQKHVEVFASDGSLDYALVVGPEQRVEFSYRLHVQNKQSDKAQAPPFVWDAARGELSFKNGPYRYVVHDSPERLGVSVHVRGKEVFLPAIESSRSGGLRGLSPDRFENLKLAK